MSLGIDGATVGQLFEKFPDTTAQAPIWAWISTLPAELMQFYANLLNQNVRNAEGWEFVCPLCKTQETWLTKLGERGVHAILAGLGCGHPSVTQADCVICHARLELALAANMTAKARVIITQPLQSLLGSPVGVPARLLEATLMAEADPVAFRACFPDFVSGLTE